MPSSGRRDGPSRVVELDEAKRPARPDRGPAGSWQRRSRRSLGAVHLQGLLGFSRQIHQLRTLACMRKAISYCVIRVAIRDHPPSCFASYSISRQHRPHLLLIRLTPCGLLRYRTVSPLLRNGRPENRLGAGRSTTGGPRWAVLAAATVAAQHDKAGKVFGVGSQAIGDPRSHAGRPEMVVPVFMNV